MLKLVANANQVIQIQVQNPTDEKHELVIESNATELASSGDNNPGTSGQLTFKPTMTGTIGSAVNTILKQGGEYGSGQSLSILLGRFIKFFEEKIHLEDQ
jgi:hypothetical protein